MEARGQTVGINDGACIDSVSQCVEKCRDVLCEGRKESEGYRVAIGLGKWIYWEGTVSVFQVSDEMCFDTKEA